jgi:hypothetical protein
VFSDDEDLVFAHPDLGAPMDRTKVKRRFQEACVAAGVRKIRFHDLALLGPGLWSERL